MSRKPFAFVTKQGNTVRAEVLERYAMKEADSRQLGPRDQKFGGQVSVKEPPYSPDAMVKLLDINTYHMRACKTKARDSAGLGWRFVEAADDPSKTERDQARERVENFSEPLSRTLEKAQYDYEAIGWGAVELIRDGSSEDLVIDVRHVPAHTVRVHNDLERWVQQRGTRRVWFKRAGEEREMNYRTGEWVDEVTPQNRANELMVWTNYTPRSDYYGIPDIIPAIGAIVGDVARRDYNISFFDNFGVPAYAVFITGDFDPGEPKDEDGNPDPDGMTDLERTVNQHFEEIVKNPHSVLVMSVPSAEDGAGEVEIELQPLSVETKEASFRLYRQDNRDEVLSAHGVDPYRVGIAETGSLGGSTAREATRIYKESVIEPRQTDLENLINKHITPLEEWELELEELDVSDPAADLDMLETLFGMGAVTPKQIAAHFTDRFNLDLDGMDDHPALNAHYVNGQPIDLEDPNPEVVEKGEVNAAMASMRDAIITAAGKALGEGPSFKHAGDGAVGDWDASDIDQALHEILEGNR